MSRAFNFSAGPGALPESVLRQAQEEMLEWRDARASVMEISHHSPAFEQLAHTSEYDFRELLNIPPQYKVLFLQGGGRSQFSMVPLNLLGNKIVIQKNTK